jgi:hypothetical protein
MGRRMFSPNIVGSDAFLEMPTSSRELYFQFGMYADDDGFVNPKRIMRLVGASEDDLKILLSKRFVLHFENGIVVIKHWKINNLVRKDWYRPSIYTEQKQSLFLKENGAYTDDYTQGVLLVNELVNELVNVGKDKIGKDIISAKAESLLDKNKKMKVYNEDQHYDENVIDIETNEPPTKEKVVKKPKESKHLKLAEVYIKYRNFFYKSESDRIRAIRRYMKPASELLVSHTGDEILDCMKWCSKKYPEWSLETVVKKIDEYKNYANS